MKLGTHGQHFTCNKCFGSDESPDVGRTVTVNNQRGALVLVISSGGELLTSATSSVADEMSLRTRS